MNESLRAAGARRGLYIGSQFKGDTIVSDATYRAVHTEQFSLSTVGNMCKWPATEKAQGVFSLEECNKAFAYARGASQKFRGHNLCWGNNNPEWLETLAKTASPKELTAVLQAHIIGVMQGVKAASGGASPLAWDVVNEATNSTAPYKPNTWYPAVPNYVDEAFAAARAADPTVLLFYNDFGVESKGRAKAEQMYDMVASMVRRGVPIDGVGLQAHLSLGAAGRADGEENYDAWFSDDIKGRSKAPESLSAVSDNIKRYGELGLQVHITEMDVKCPDPCDAEMLAKQADVYGLLLKACLAHPGVCTSFETWGFTDEYTWLKGKRCNSSTGKEDCHPLPFNATYSPKPAASRMLWLLHGGGRGEDAMVESRDWK